MDLVRRYIAVADDRPEHEIEQADTDVDGIAAQLLSEGNVVPVAVYTNDRAAFRGIERALSSHGYEQQVELISALDLFESVQRRHRFHD